MSQQTATAAVTLPEVSITPGMIPAVIGAAFAGGIYAGILRGLDGQPDSHLIAIDGEAEDVTWDEAMAFAASVGGDLGTRRELRLACVNLQDKFSHDDWYWSCEQYAANPTSAWGQGFGNGGQSYDPKASSGRARAFRKLPIR